MWGNIQSAYRIHSCMFGIVCLNSQKTAVLISLGNKYTNFHNILTKTTTDIQYSENSIQSSLSGMPVKYNNFLLFVIDDKNCNITSAERSLNALTPLYLKN